MKQKAKRDKETLNFLSGGGEMGKLIQSRDWSNTPLGPIESWPQSLKTAVSMCIASNFPICLIWGSQYVQLYNDGYRPICGAMHPRSMGQDFTECWAAAWDVIGGSFHQALAGEPSFLENQRIFLNRNGYSEETFFSFSFSPIRDETGGIGGLLHPVVEQTDKMLSERRARTLRDLSARITDAKTVEEVFKLSAQVFKVNNLDTSFVLFYQLTSDGKIAKLAASEGLPLGTQANLSLVDLQSESLSWPFAEVIQSRRGVQVDDLERLFGPLPCEPYPESPKTAFVLPINPPGSERPVAILVAGLSARLPLTEVYHDFFDLLVAAITATVANAQAYDEERKRAEALAEIDRAKTVFFSNVSHEFRTPLTLMLGSIEESLAEKSTLSTVQRERTEMLHRNSLRLLRLVNSLLDFSRIEEGRVQAVFESADLSELTANLASNFRSAIEKANMKLIIDVAKIKEPVYVDREMWEKIVLNLLSNAFKYTYKGKITVSLKEKKGAVALSIADTGVGIPEKELPRMFERFHRVEGTEGRTHEGTGIGLSLVQELVKLHGGKITIESIEGKGSTFTVTILTGKSHLPQDRISVKRDLLKTAMGANAYVEEALRWLPGHEESSEIILDMPIEFPTLEKLLNGEQKQKARILLADDNADMREYITRLLSQKYEVVAVADGKAALASIQKQKPDLVLTDIMMPVLDGFGLLKEIRANKEISTLPVIMLSARAGEEAKILGIDANANDYLVKPFSARELMARVAANLEMAEILKKYQAATENERKRLYELFMEAPAIIAVLRGSEHVYELANPRYMQLIGNDRNIIGKPIREALPELREQGIYELLDGVYTTGKPFFGDELFIRLDKKGNEELEDGYFNFVYQPTYDGKGNVDGILAHAVEVTEQVLSRKKIEESETKFRTLIEDAPVATCFFTGRELTIEVANDRMLGVWGKDKNVIGKTLIEAIPELEGQPWLQKLDEVFTTGKTYSAKNALAQLEVDGVLGNYYFNFTYKAIRNAAGEVYGIIYMAVDVTEQVLALKKLESSEQKLEKAVISRTSELQEANLTLNEKNTELGKANKELETFTFISSHDLQEPLRKITYFVNLMIDKEKENLSDQGKYYLQRTSETAKRMRALIEDLLTYSRAATSEIKFEKSDLNIIVAEIKNDFQELLIAKNATMEITHLCDSNIIQFQFRQLMQNLVSNSLKFVKQGKASHIYIKSDTVKGSKLDNKQLLPNVEYCHITYTDNGIGFDPKYNERIFEVFERLHGDDEYKGTGIGLAICKRIAENHKGIITATGEVNKGVRFDIYIPAS